MNREPDIDFLTEILSLKRPHRGTNERYLAETLIASRVPDLMEFKDKTGAAMAYMYTTDEKSKTLFVAHLDTVHKEDGHNPVQYDEGMQLMYKTDGTPLGADDGAGVWLLVEMIQAGVPGTYLFTVGEEKGGVGAKFMADTHEALLSNYDRAVAFDRRGTSSIITAQFSGTCCSDEFAEALAAELNGASDYLDMEPDETGVYTDTAEFTTVIPECTNISVGYDREHTGGETQDVWYLLNLRDAVLSIDWESLPTVRDPKDVSSMVWGSSKLGAGAWDTGFGSLDFSRYEPQSLDELLDMTDTDIESVVFDNPDLVVALLMDVKYNWVATTTTKGANDE